MITLRQATVADFESVLPLIVDAFDHSVLSERSTLDISRVYRSFVVSATMPNFFSRVVEKDGQVVNFMVGVATEGYWGGTVASDWIVCRGPGTVQLLRAFHKWATSAGVDVVQITTSSGSERYDRLISRLGFEKVGSMFVGKA